MRISVKVSRFLKAFCFTAVFLALLCLVSYILRPYSGSASRKNICGFYGEEEDSLDVVFVGSSSCFAFWEPMEFWKEYGAASYNFATGTLPPQFIKYCLKEVRKTQSPDLYVIDLRPFTVAERGYYREKEVANMDHDVPIRNICDNFKYSWNRVEMIREGVPDSYDKLPYYVDIIKYHTEWTRLWDKQSLSYAANESHDSLKGFKLVEKVKAVEFHDYSEVTGQLELSERLDGILDDLLAYCGEEDLNVLFLVNAYCQTKKEKKTYNYMEEKIRSAGFDFLNTNDYWEEIGLDYDRDYYDASHVNIFGADKYTSFVGDYLMEHYDLADHRGEERYESWEWDYAVWSAEAQGTKEAISGLLGQQ